MAKLTITGSTQPVVGNTEAYSLSVFDNLMSSNPFSFPPPKIQWNIHVQDKKGWRIAQGNVKEGEHITYQFTHKSLKYKAIKIEVKRGKDKGELYLKPKQAEEPKILRVDVLDINSQRLQKGKLLHYTDTLIAKAHCVGMFGHKVSFTLWEDDAIGKGHDPVINMMNRINPVPLVAEVDHEGIAKVLFRLPSYTMAVQIANTQVARGDQSEGKTHEYYVTAEMTSKHILKASPNVNVVNPTYIPEPVKKPTPKETHDIHRRPPAAPEKNSVKPDKPKPKTETPKFPQTPAAKKQVDPEGKIVSAEFTDSTGKPLKSAKNGDAVSIKIITQNMKGKNIKVRIWEEDLSRYSNDLVYESSVTLAYHTTNFINGIILTKEMYNKSNDWGESNEREYFIEVEHLNTSVTSQVIPVNPDAEPVKVDANDSAAVIKEPKLQSKNCGGKYCIDKNSPPNELIREINIRLAGFGGNVPTDRFTDRTEKMIKQFQRDYMKVPETGKVCGNVLKAIDEFSGKYLIDFTEMKCKCKKCSGFGSGKYSEEKQKSSIAELNRKYEYPGIHRSLLWGFKALNFYLSNKEKNLNYSIKCVFSGYRCWYDNLANNRNSTNHMGKAIDIHFNKNGKRTQSIDDMEKIRDKVIIPYMGGQLRWGESDKFSVEPTRKAYKKEFIATTWIHLDVRQFQIEYLEDKYFVKDTAKLNGKNMVVLAMELGFSNTCSCMVTEKSAITDKPNKIKNDRIDPKTLITSQKGKDFIKDWEKYHKMPYDDSEGYATIGYGYLLAYKSYKNLTKSEVEKTDITWNEFQKGITKERALEIFEDKIKKYEKSIYRDVTVKLYQYEFDALVSLLFNCGPDFLKNRKAPKLYNNLLAEKYEDAANEFLDITNDGTSGLVKRRKAENDMFLNNNYDATN